MKNFTLLLMTLFATLSWAQNDTAETAIPITPSVEGTGCTTPTFINSTAGDGTTDSGLNGTCNTNSGVDNTGLDRFYTWTATELGLVYNFGEGGPGIVIREATAPYNEIDCATTFASLNSQLSGWAIGDHLIIQIYDFGLSDADTSFCLETRAVLIPIPANDACVDATIVSSLPYNTTLDAAAATNNAGYIDDDSCGPMNDGVWYTFTTDIAGTIDIAITDIDGWDAAIALYSGSCDTLICENRADAEDVGIDESLTGTAVAANTQYWINIAFPSNATDRAEGPFTIDITSDTILTIANNVIEGLSMYPNPVNNVLQFNSHENINSISIYNLLGQEVVKTQPNVSNTEINMYNLPTGVYVVKVQVGEQLGSYQVVKK